VGFIFSIPTVLFVLPFGTTAQGYGYMALMTQLGNNLNSFAPFQPETQYVISNGFTALTAYLSQQLNTGIHTTQFGVGAVLALLNVWLAYDFGSELRAKSLGRAMGLAMLLGLGIMGLLVEGAFMMLMGIAFSQAFLIFAWRFQKYNYLVDALFAGLMLGAVLLAHHTSFIILMLAYIPYLGTMWLGDTRPTRRTWLIMIFGIPAIALIATAPWLIKILSLLGTGLEAGIGSPYTRSTDNMLVMVTNHGLWLAPMALFGAWLGWQKRETIAILCIVWIFLMLDFSSTGGIAALFPFIDRFINPKDLAWGGIIIPYSVLAGGAMLWLWDAYGADKIRMKYRTAYLINGALALILIALVFLRDPLLDVAKPLVNLPNQYTSPADDVALRWINTNAPTETIILNFPVSPETDWAAVIAEREAIYFPSLPYAFGDADSLAIQEALKAFWRNPADPTNADLLRQYGVTHVFVPEIIVNRDSLETAWRWGTPAAWSFDMTSSVDDAPYLELVYGEAGRGAQVYALIEN